MITLPHMLGTAAEYRTVDGLKPDAKKHLIFADIEPVCIFFSLNYHSLLLDYIVLFFFNQNVLCFTLSWWAEHRISGARCKTASAQYVPKTNQSN